MVEVKCGESTIILDRSCPRGRQMEMAFLGHLGVRKEAGLQVTDSFSLHLGKIQSRVRAKCFFDRKGAFIYLMLGKKGEEKVQSPVQRAGEEDLGIALLSRSHEHL